MKQSAKKIMSIFIMAVLVSLSVVMPLNTIKVQAATKLKANITYSESICCENKTYNFTMPSSGYFWYEITPMYYTKDGEEATSNNWYIKHTMTVNYKQYENTKSYYGSTWRSFRYNFKKNTNVQIKIVEDSDESNVWYYKIRIVTKKIKNFETENNNSRSKASSLKVNKSYTGNFIQDDTDWWVFTASKSGTYRIAGVISDGDYESTVSKKNASYAYLNTLKAICYVDYKFKGENRIDEVNGYKTLFKGKLKKGQKVYIKIAYDNWIDVFYKINVKKLK